MGILEGDEMYCLESEKGARQLARPPRKRGEAATQRGLSFEQVCITHYLPNYLGWHRAVDRDRIASPEDMLSSAVGYFPH